MRATACNRTLSSRWGCRRGKRDVAASVGVSAPPGASQDHRDPMAENRWPRIDGRDSTAETREHGQQQRQLASIDNERLWGETLLLGRSACLRRTRGTRARFIHPVKGAKKRAGVSTLARYETGKTKNEERREKRVGHADDVIYIYICMYIQKV